jgi:hypothetical protein
MAGNTASIGITSRDSRFATTPPNLRWRPSRVRWRAVTSSGRLLPVRLAVAVTVSGRLLVALIVGLRLRARRRGGGRGLVGGSAAATVGVAQRDILTVGVLDDGVDELGLLESLVAAHLELRGDVLQLGQLLAGEDAAVHRSTPRPES